VVGDGPERKNLERLGKALNCKIFFAGEINRDQIEEFFARSRIFVLNSYYEGLPHALIESRATGMIAVGRSGTGSEEVINDGVDGFLVTETRSLFETLDEALRIESVSNSLGSKAAQDTRLRFNQNINFERILEVVSVS
jgi:glycosyltransferase involved in cell wall biosynthesis